MPEQAGGAGPGGEAGAGATGAGAAGAAGAAPEGEALALLAEELLRLKNVVADKEAALAVERRHAAGHAEVRAVPRCYSSGSPHFLEKSAKRKHS